MEILNSNKELEIFDVEKLTSSLNLINLNEELVLSIVSFVENEIQKSLGNKILSIDDINNFIFDFFEEFDLIKEKELYRYFINEKKNKFKLKNSFVDLYRNKEVNFGEMGYLVYKRTYSRYIHQENRSEEFYETIRRCVEGCYSIQKKHCKEFGLSWSDEKANKSAQIMYDKMFNFKFLPPGRSLWMMGTKYIDDHGSMALNNCGFVSTENIDNLGPICFPWSMDCLMLGVGIGFDTKGAGKVIIKSPNFSNEKFIIPDSREGWVFSYRKVIFGYFNSEPIPIFDYSKIRKKGEPIKKFGGVSSGPEPLIELIEKSKDLLNSYIDKPIDSTLIVDLMNMIGKCVVAGNVRRSAEIAIGSCYDQEFIELKDDHDKLMDYRWCSNNSIDIEEGFDIDSLKERFVHGEPGITFIENARKFGRLKDGPNYVDKLAKGFNPCGEQTLESFELCCLSETFPSNHYSLEEFIETLKYAYLFAKSVTLVNTHWKITNNVMMKNRRIGISQTGIIDAFVKHGRKNILDWCDTAYNYLLELDKEYSNWLGVPRSKKLTTVKPSGTVSLLPGVSPGIHYPHSEYYIRRIRISENSDILDYIKDRGFYFEKDKYSPNTICVEIPIKTKYYEYSKEDITVWEQFQNLVDYQTYWSDNNVSITVSFNKNEIDQLIKCIKIHSGKIKGLSFYSIDEKTYEQAPYEKISKETYNNMIEKINKIKRPINVVSSGENYCNNDSCII